MDTCSPRASSSTWKQHHHVPILAQSHLLEANMSYHNMSAQPAVQAKRKALRGGTGVIQTCWQGRESVGEGVGQDTHRERASMCCRKVLEEKGWDGARSGLAVGREN